MFSYLFYDDTFRIIQNSLKNKCSFPCDTGLEIGIQVAASLWSIFTVTLRSAKFVSFIIS